MEQTIRRERLGMSLRANNIILANCARLHINVSRVRASALYHWRQGRINERSANATLIVNGAALKAAAIINELRHRAGFDPSSSFLKPTVKGVCAAGPRYVSTRLDALSGRGSTNGAIGSARTRAACLEVGVALA